MLKPGGRLVVGELLGDPHYVTQGMLERRSEAAGLRFERRVGPQLGYFARFRGQTRRRRRSPYAASAGQRRSSASRTPRPPPADARPELGLGLVGLAGR